MGSSDTGTSTGVVDCTVGAIVWVRRRNGSWWPGKILGAEDLSASHLMSPRSGTPVKLLGREDASVDWYNLEKSKRVKAFRCGEFDDCIDKAEAAQGMPPKKREKYARREDAIIHALELEKQFLEKQYGKLGSNCKSNIKKELATSAESLRRGNGKVAEPKSQQPSGGPDLPPCGIISPHLQMQEVREGKQPSWDDDNADVLPRMRGLQDIGLKITSSKHKISPSVDSTGPLKSPLTDSTHTSLNGNVSAENTNHANDKASSEKRKRLYDGLAEDSLVKRRDRCRPLVQVLESSEKLPAPPLLKPEDDIVSLDVRGEEQTGGVGSGKRSKCVYQTKSSDSKDNAETPSEHMEVSASKLEDNSNPRAARAALGKDDTSGSTEDTETDSSETDSLESDTDGEMDEISDESVEFRPKSMVKGEVQEEDDNTSTEETDDPATPSDMSHPSNDDISASAGVSKWQLKRKRNTRAKRYVDLSGGKVSKGSIQGTIQGTKLKGKGVYDDMMDSFDKKYGTGIGGYGSRGLDGINRNVTRWEDLAWNDQRVSKGYWGDPIEYTDPVYSRRQFGDRRKCMLVEVDLKVQSNYQREHVPMISLMSKLNGQAIVGHPIQIETLDNGSTQALLNAADELNQDNDTSLPPVWRTARRTANCRVPRPRASSTVDEDEGIEHYQDRKIQLNKSNGGNFSNKKSLARKGSTLGSRPSTGTDKRLLKKTSKKTNVVSNQKTRTLSSIATQQKPNNNILKHGSNSYHVNGLIKPETVPTTVACIPIKLVFSRLHEELAGRHQ